MPHAKEAWSPGCPGELARLTTTYPQWAALIPLHSPADGEEPSLRKVHKTQQAFGLCEPELGDEKDRPLSPINGTTCHTPFQSSRPPSQRGSPALSQTELAGQEPPSNPDGSAQLQLSAEHTLTDPGSKGRVKPRWAK